MAKKKVSKKRNSRRRSSMRKVVKPKTRRKATTTRSTQSSRQLAVYLDPFSTKTLQPKIPDGKVHKSLGLSNQSSGEAIASNDQAGFGTQTPRDGILHILMYSGQNTGAVMFNDVRGQRTDAGDIYDNQTPAVSFMDYEGSPEITFSTVTPGGGELIFANSYASWRTVSQGLKLGLLNPAETDDGWWECIRVNEAVDTDEYTVQARDNGTSSAIGTVSPRFLFADLVGRNLANESTYRTGLLRDIHNQKFDLMPTYKDHDFAQQMDVFDVTDEDVLLASTFGAPEAGRYITFSDGKDNVRQLINMFVDPSFDMMYIRIHGRAGDSEPTRIHYNLVSNQEVTFSSGTRESRFMDETENRPLEVITAKRKKRDQEHKRPGA